MPPVPPPSSRSSRCTPAAADAAHRRSTRARRRRAAAAATRWPSAAAHGARRPPAPLPPRPLPPSGGGRPLSLPPRRRQRRGRPRPAHAPAAAAPRGSAANAGDRREWNLCRPAGGSRAAAEKRPPPARAAPRCHPAGRHSRARAAVGAPRRPPSPLAAALTRNAKGEAGATGRAPRRCVSPAVPPPTLPCRCPACPLSALPILFRGDLAASPPPLPSPPSPCHHSWTGGPGATALSRR